MARALIHARASRARRAPPLSFLLSLLSLSLSLSSTLLLARISVPSFSPCSSWASPPSSPASCGPTVWIKVRCIRVPQLSRSVPPPPWACLPAACLLTRRAAVGSSSPDEACPRVPSDVPVRRVGAFDAVGSCPMCLHKVRARIQPCSGLCVVCFPPQPHCPFPSACLPVSMSPPAERCVIPGLETDPATFIHIWFKRLVEHLRKVASMATVVMRRLLW